MTETHSPVDVDYMIGSVKETLEANPGYAELCTKLGLLYSLKKHFSEARSQFQQCLLINPSDIEARVNLALLDIQQQECREAGAILEECLEIEPDNGLCRHLLGVVLLVQGNRDKASEQFEKTARAHRFYRLQYEQFGAMKGQRIYLNGPSERKLIENGKSLYRANLHYFVGQCYTEMGEIEKAIQEFRKAKRVDSNGYKSHLRIGVLYDLQGEYKKAIQEFQKVAKIFPDCGVAHAQMSYAYGGLGDFESALTSLKKAVEIHPQDADLRYQLGLLYGDLQMDQEAIEELRTAVKIDPKYLFARINLGVLYEKIGQTERALREYEELAELITEDKDLVDRIEQIRNQTVTSSHNPSNRPEHPKNG